MTAALYRFGDFLLDPADRRLSRAGTRVEVNARYLDALTLLVSESGRLVSKDRFLDEVWSGVPVTDEALTQCIRSLRRLLGDDAASPRYIETVPKHGYRFIASVELVDPGDRGREAASPAAAPQPAANGTEREEDWSRFLATCGGALVGGGMAGLVGGLFYGFLGAAQPLQAGLGAASVLLVIVSLTIVAALAGAAGVGIGIAAANFASSRFSAWSIAGGAAGGMIVGAFGKLLGLDAFNLLLGQSPGDITGALEGAVLGAAVGLGAWLAGRETQAQRDSRGQSEGRSNPLRRSVAAAGLAGSLAGAAITALGGRLMAGSLDSLARNVAGSRLRLDQIGLLFGESGLGRISQIVTGALEGLLFGAFLVGFMILARRSRLGGR